MENKELYKNMKQYWCGLCHKPIDLPTKSAFLDCCPKCYYKHTIVKLVPLILVGGVLYIVFEYIV